jgi:hypothetical protein
VRLLYDRFDHAALAERLAADFVTRSSAAATGSRRPRRVRERRLLPGR